MLVYLVYVFEYIESSVKESMKAYDNIRRDCLRSIISEVKNQTINAGKEITDDICMKVLQKSVKSHNDSIAQFSYAGRNDLLEKEKTEVGIINEFLPKMMDDNAIEAFAKSIVQQLSNRFGRPITKKDMGIIMKTITTSKDAASINMKTASKVVASLLA